MTDSPSPSNRVRTTLARAHLRPDLPWLATAVAITALLSVVYYLTHPFPAYGAGLYLEMAERIVANGYAPPETISGYTADGLPFAFPPLMFYVLAVLLDLGADPVGVAWLLPAVATAASLVALYVAARELLGSRTAAGLATTVYAASPFAITWHLSAGGVVRAPAFLFAMVGLYCGVKLFETAPRPNRWIAPAALAFGLTALTHPIYAEFFGVTFLTLYAGFDRSLAGLLRGSVVAAGGLVVAAPWWLRVVLTYGPETITGAAGTHSGLVGGPTAVRSLLVDPVLATTPLSVGPAVVLVCVAVALLAAVARAVEVGPRRLSTGTDRTEVAIRRRLVLVGWLLVTAAFVTKQRFVFVPGGLLVGAYAADALDARPSVPGLAGERSGRSILATLAVGGVVGGLLLGAALGAAGHSAAGDRALVSFVDDDGQAAMEWVRTETPPDARFVVLGMAGEWFPYLTDRTMLVSPWGSEWVPGGRERHHTMHKRLSSCDTADCITAVTDRYGLSPDYVYVQKGTPMAWSPGSEEMGRSLGRSDRYRVVFENEGGIVVRVCPDGRC